MDTSGKVFLFRLFEKQSARGNTYYSGRLGGASVVMFKDDFTEGKDPCWQVFVQEPPKVQQSGKPAAAPAAPPAPEPKRRRRKARANPRAERLAGDWQPPDEPLNL